MYVKFVDVLMNGKENQLH